MSDQRSSDQRRPWTIIQWAEYLKRSTEMRYDAEDARIRRIVREELDLWEARQEQRRERQHD